MKQEVNHRNVLHQNENLMKVINDFWAKIFDCKGTIGFYIQNNGVARWKIWYLSNIHRWSQFRDVDRFAP